MAVAPNPVERLSRALSGRFADARARTDELFSLLKPDSLYDRPIPERHRIIFYIGHLEAFDWNLLRERLLGIPSFNPALDRLFAFGIDPVDGGLPSDQPKDWPAIAQVREYVSQVREELDDELDALFASPERQAEFAPELLLNVAIEHRLMHAETLAYMFHQLPLDRKARPRLDRAMEGPAFQASRTRMIEIPSGPITLGMPRDGGQFGWDNEFESQQVNVPAFAIDEFKVTHGEFLEFLNSGGYDRQDLWSEEDWNWRRQARIEHPVFWVQRDRQWFYRGMFEEFALPMTWPVYVSHAEAAAFARWAGKALPTEAQWQRAAYGGTDKITPKGNFDFERWDPAPVNSDAGGSSALGVRDIFGNGWEWTSTLFGPLPGFQKFPFYPGYSADFFDGKHYVMKGGSSRTAACMMRPSFRNWFQPHYQYVYAGFRCVRSA
ncbi:MAG TPA: SUMF1/EgtB/PvdO family nonheme iron enzyme [Terriglobales bacterium]|nr:SUMF1/EgtB/PvdO family nonheme iron enzyme [Terriglobales bacterium]